MHENGIQDILPLVRKPSAYLGAETGRIAKDHAAVALTVALAFPDLYEIGTSHFGVQILYHILNNNREIAAERVFAPGEDLGEQLRASGLPLFSLETKTPLKDFDILGFSLLYELNYTNVLYMLDLAGIPFRAEDRGPEHPVLIAGGPCTVNPAPMADFFDAMVVGDGEETAVAMMDAASRWKKGAADDKEALLKEWSKIPGVFVPSLFDPQQDGVVKRAILADLDAAPFPTSPVIPFGKPVHDRLRLEIARGCTRGCRFCQAGMIYRPVRERKVAALLELAERSLAETGYEDLSLLSLSTGDYGCIGALLSGVMDRFGHKKVAVSLPSLRAGTLTPEIMELIKKVRKTGFTIAPEAASERLRRVINKNVTEEDIRGTVQSAFELGWQVIKLYFMIGLPFETEADVAEIPALVKRLLSLRGKRRGKINVSVATFIPKPHTPFQWAAQKELAEAKEIIDRMKATVTGGGVQLKWQQPEVSLLEGLWSRGDRSFSRFLEAAYRKGCRFDGWSDHFNYDAWIAAAEECGVDIAGSMAEKDPAAKLPWDFIDTGVTREFLATEWLRAKEEGRTDDCRFGECNFCGVCDFKTVMPRADMECPAAEKPPAPAPEPEEKKKIRVTYAKTGPARFLGHLEMVRIITRAVRRADIPVVFSKGFHPMPKIAFSDPLPVGMESEMEWFELTVPMNVRPASVFEGLSGLFPDGIAVLEAGIAPLKRPQPGPEAVSYRVFLDPEWADKARITAFLEGGECILSRANRKGKLKKIDLRAIVETMIVTGPGEIRLKMITSPGETVRPAELLSRVLDLSETRALRLRVVKTADRETGPDVP